MGKCLDVIAYTVRSDPLYVFLVRALSLILINNYFTFNNTLWVQTTGIAMGTPVAPTIATLYLAHFEQRHIFTSPLWQKELRLFKRYIDDLFIVWENTSDINDLTRLFTFQPGIEWIPGDFGNSVPFLDLQSSLTETTPRKFKTQTFQKPLNLYLYTPFASAHPPHCLPGLIKGLLLKYKFQNSDFEDFLQLAQKFANRLALRGYKPPLLRRIFNPLLEQAASNTLVARNASTNTSSTTDEPLRKLFFRVLFDPNGPSSRDLYRISELEHLQKLLTKYDKGRVILCYKRNRNLRDMLCSTGERITSVDL